MAADAGFGKWRERSHIERRDTNRGKERQTEHREKSDRGRGRETEKRATGDRQTETEMDGRRGTRTERKPSQQCSPLISALETLAAGSLSG